MEVLFEFLAKIIAEIVGEIVMGTLFTIIFGFCGEYYLQIRYNTAEKRAFVLKNDYDGSPAMLFYTKTVQFFVGIFAILLFSGALMVLWQIAKNFI